MSSEPEYALLPTDSLREHEEVVASDVDRMVKTLSRSRIVREPILVSREGRVILNGHHRYAALRALGAARVPAWVVDYTDEKVQLDRWSPGPPISKRDVLDRAQSGTLYPPKTTRHRLHLTLPARPTPFEELFDGPGGPGPPMTGHRAHGAEPRPSPGEARAPDAG